MGGGDRARRASTRAWPSTPWSATSTSHLDRSPTAGRRLFAFLGGTIGNLDPDQRRRFLVELATARWTTGDRLLLGTDLVKDRARLVAAYDDAAGVTAEFNRNVLRVLNRELGADFDPERFDARGPLERGRPADRDVAARRPRAQRVRVRRPRPGGRPSRAARRCSPRSAPSSPPNGSWTELTEAGFVVDGLWGAEGGEFLLVLAHPYC